MNANWGHCKHCQHFGSPASMPLGEEEAPCGNPLLSRYGLRVFGSSGCNAFYLRAGLSESVERAPAHVEL